LDARNINVDDGGIGRGVIDQLHQKGWPVNRILNQSKSLIGHEYGNRGAELWFSFARLIQESVISGLKDPLLIEQLSTRYYKRSEALGKLVLEGKKEAKAEGRKSPDRADALVLAFAGTDIREFLHTCGSDLWTSQVKSPADKAKNKYQSMEELIEFMHSVKFGLTPAKRVKENFGTVDTNRGRTYVDLYYDGINSN
jgi:hypothetical protein